MASSHREEARPAGLEPATPGLEDRSSQLLKDADFHGAVRLPVAAFAARALKPVESCGFRVQPAATVLLQLNNVLSQRSLTLPTEPRMRVALVR